MQVNGINCIDVQIFHYDLHPVKVGGAWTAGYSVKLVP